MPKYNKVYTSFYNGISQQIPELMHETNCLDMVNCIPDLINGATKRPPCKYNGDSENEHSASRVFHSYGRGEDLEEYIMSCNIGQWGNNIGICDPQGQSFNVDWDLDDGDYLDTTDHRTIKAVTVQDTTFIINTDKVVGIEDTAQDATTSTSAILYLSGATITCERILPPPGWSGVITFEAQYVVHVEIEVDGDLYSRSTPLQVHTGYSAVISVLDLVKSTYMSLINSLPGFSAVASGANNILITKTNSAEFTLYAGGSIGAYLSVTQGSIAQNIVTTSNVSTSTSATSSAFYWAKRASGDDLHQWRYVVYLDGTTYEAVHHESDKAMELLANAINASSSFVAQRNGSTIKIDRRDTQDFTFSSWDSWGDQASFGWKGSVAQLTNLPNDLGWEGHVVQITGTDADDFTDYFVRSTKSAWQECRDPRDTRGQLINMPKVLTRQANGAFTLTEGKWELPNVGSTDTNPTPSFVGTKLTDIFFYKNRLGLACEDNVVFSELGGYYNFYIKSVLTILDTDPIDIALSTTSANRIQHVVPFQSSLFIFTKESQYELTYNGTLTPLTVVVDLVSSYPMAINVKPVVSGDSLYFISITRRRQQLRHYKKNNDTLNVVGIDLNLTTPTLMEKEITNILINEVLGYVICATSTFEVYLYNYRDNSSERVQSAWSRWEFFQGLDWDNYTHWQEIDTTSVQYSLIGSNLFLTMTAEGGGQ